VDAPYDEERGVVGPYPALALLGRGVLRAVLEAESVAPGGAIGGVTDVHAQRLRTGYGYSTEFDVERYFRDAPLMIVGEGTNEIQRNVIASQLVKRGGLDI